MQAPYSHSQQPHAVASRPKYREPTAAGDADDDDGADDADDDDDDEEDAIFFEVSPHSGRVHVHAAADGARPPRDGPLRGIALELGRGPERQEGRAVGHVLRDVSTDVVRHRGAAAHGSGSVACV